jgi:signal peptidase I
VRWVLGGAVVVILGTFIATAAVAWHEGYRVYAVRTGSMTPTLPVGSLLVDAPPSGSYERGAVVTIQRPGTGDERLVTHRVHAVRPAGLQTKGDANPKPDLFLAQPSAVVGEVVAHVPRGGYVFVYFSQWTGVLSLMMVLLTIRLAWAMCFPATATSAREEEAPVEPSNGPRVPRQRSEEIDRAVVLSDPRTLEPASDSVGAG